MPAKSGDKAQEESITVQLEHVCLQYPYKTLEAATKNFHTSCRLGEGSAGTVFKGELPDGSYAAVKVIDLSTLGDNLMVAGFEDEIMILSKFRHPNLVVLMGWAKEGSRRFLLYEFLSGGDVSGRLNKSKTGRMPFLWHERLSVARDAATGLAYLHNATPRAFHRDIKTSNILMGGSGAKMADFGLSVVAKTRTGSGVDCEFPSGTPGYACPIYMRTGKVTEGSEVHSFGMVLLEVLLNLVPAGMVGGEVKFPIQEIVKPHLPGALDRAVQSADPTAGWLPQVAREVGALALRCIDADESRRPCFTEICRQLRALQEQFPPTAVLAPSLPSFGGPPGPPMPAMTGACPPLSPLQAIAPQGPGPPPGSVWMPGPQPPWTAPPQGLPPGALPPPGSMPPPGTMAPGTMAPPMAPASLRLPPGAPIAAPAMAPPPFPAAGPPPFAMVQVARPAMPVAVPVATAPPPMPEVALEITYVHLAVLSMMRPEFRMLPLRAESVDGEGRRMARLGRAHQPQWFEAVLVDATDLGSVSREACEFCWGGPDGAVLLRSIGSTIVIVDDEMVNRGNSIPLRPGSRIVLARQLPTELCVIISLALHCALPPRRAVQPPPTPPAPANRSVLVHVEAVGKSPPARGSSLEQAATLSPEASWRLECVYSSLTPEALLSLPAAVRTISLPLTGGLVGRQHQPETFEALLGRENPLLAYVSRTHFKLEADEAGTVRVSNLSQNIAVVAQRPLHQNDSVTVADGDTLSFAHTRAQALEALNQQPPADDGTLKPIDATVNILPFLTLRLVGPPPLLPASPFEMLNSLPIASSMSEGALPASLPASQPAFDPNAAAGSSHLTGRHALEETPPAATMPSRLPGREGGVVNIDGIAVESPSTAPFPKASLLCNAGAAHQKGGECQVM